MTKTVSIIALVFGFAVVGTAQPLPPVPDAVVPQVRPLPPLRQQAEEQLAWTKDRLDTVLPALMREYGVDTWVLSMREYGEDPVFWSIASPTTFAARRRSIYIFHDEGPGQGVRRIALGGTSQGGLFEVYRHPDQSVEGRELYMDAQWRTFRDLMQQLDPQQIVLNIDGEHAFADGLHSGEREKIEAALGDMVDRVVREPRLAINYIATRVPAMLPRYRQIEETVHAIIAEAFSSAVITPGETTAQDVVWWLREKVRSLGMTTWFQPSVAVFRHGGVEGDDPVIQRGDMLWTDFGVIAMGLKTDTQHLGYVLREGETEPPAGLQAGLATSNRLQDILLEEMVPGRTGNEILAATLAQMRAENIDGTMYTHPIGDHGHGAGPLIGLWDRQDGVPVRGDLVLRPMTWHSTELQTTNAVPEWDGQRIPFRQEEEVYLDADGNRHWTFRRQDRFHLIW